MRESPYRQPDTSGGGSRGFEIPDVTHVTLQKHRKIGAFLTGQPPEIVKKNRYGRIESRTAHTTDGLRYDVFSGIPNEPITTISGLSSPAWFTAIDDGHNMRTQLRMLKAGIPWDFVSIERNPLHKMDMTKSASYLLDIHAATAAEYGRNPEAIIASGVSQGAMKTLGVVALAPYRNVHVIHFEAIAPCCAEKTPLLPPAEQARDVLAAECESLKLLMMMKKSILLRYPGTLDTSPTNIVNSFLNQQELRSGKAGAYAAAIPANQVGHHVYPIGDIWLGQGETYAAIFADHQGITSEGIKVGGHLGCVVDEISDAHRDRVIDAVHTYEARAAS